MTGHRRRALGFLSSIIVALVVSIPSLAGEVREAPVVFLTGSIRSLDRLAAAAASLGLPLPGNLTPKGVEDWLSLGERGGVDGGKPLAIFGFWGPDRETSNLFGTAVPVRNEVAFRKSYEDAGGETSPDHPDVIGVNTPMPAKVAGGYAVMASDARVSASFEPEELTKGYAEDNAVARATLDLRRLRERHPGGLIAFLKALSRRGSGASKLDPAEEKPLKFLSESVPDLVEASVHGPDKGIVRARAVLSPVRVGGTKAFPKPVLPAECPFRIDLAPPPEVFRKVLLFMDSVMGKEEGWDEKLGPEDRARLREWFCDIVEFHFGGEAISFSLARIDDTYVFFSVRRFPEPVDVEGTARSLESRSKKFCNLVPEWDPVEHETYRLAAGTVVHRFADTDGGTADFFADFVADGRTLYSTFTDVPGRYIDRLLGLGIDGEMSGPVSFEVDLDAFARFLVMDPGLELHPLKASFAGASFRPFRGTRVECVSRTGESDVTIEVSVPAELVSGVMGLGMALGLAGDYESGPAKVEAASRRIDRFPDHAKLYIERAKALSDMGCHDDAIADAEQAIELGSRHEDAYFQLSWSAYMLGCYEDAIRHRKRYYEVLDSPSDWQTVWYVERLWQWAQAGMLHEELRKVEARIAECAADEEKREWPRHVLRYLNGDITGEALVEASRERNAARRESNARYVIGLKRLYEGDPWTALVELEKSVLIGKEHDFDVRAAEHEFAPLNARLDEWHEARAEFLRHANAGKHEKAIEAYEDYAGAAEWFGTDCLLMGTTIMERGQLALGIGNPAKAEMLYLKALRIWRSSGERKPILAQIENLLGVARWQQGRKEEALPNFISAVSLYEEILGAEHPDLSQPLRNLALARWHAGNRAESEKLYRRALAVDEKAHGKTSPQVAQGLDELAAACEALGKTEAAAGLKARAAQIRAATKP